MNDRPSVITTQSACVADLIEPGQGQVACVERVARDSLQHLGVMNSASHIEIIDPEDGTSPVVIDFGLRLQGLVDPSCPLAAYGSTPVLETALAALDPDAYAARAALTHRRRCRSITLHAPRDGILKTEIPWRLLETLPGVHSVRKAALRKGTEVSRTEDAFSSLGTVYLISDEAGIEKTTTEVRNVELNSEFYECIA